MRRDGQRGDGQGRPAGGHWYIGLFGQLDIWSGSPGLELWKFDLSGLDPDTARNHLPPRKYLGRHELLAYLTTHRQRTTVGTLLDELWYVRRPGKASNNVIEGLVKDVSKLRTAGTQKDPGDSLGDSLIPSISINADDADVVAMRAGTFTTDVKQFRDFLEFLHDRDPHTGEVNLDRVNLLDRVARCIKAALYYQGPFLNGYPYAPLSAKSPEEPWFVRERKDLERLYQSCLEQLTSDLDELGRSDLAALCRPAGASGLLLDERTRERLRAWLAERESDFPLVHEDCALTERQVREVRLPAGYGKIGADCRLVASGGNFALYWPEVNARIGDAENPVRADETYFRNTVVPRDVQSYALHHLHRKKRVTRNEQKVRLATSLTPDALADGRTVTLQRATYFDGLLTNELVGFNFAYKDAPDADTFAFEGLRLLGERLNTSPPSVAVYDLETSPCSNHIGVSSLVFTQDDHLVIVTQSKDSAASASKLAPSGSGSADWQDVPGETTLRRILVRALEREFLEEAGLDDVEDVAMRSCLIGYALLLHRAAKPDFYAVSFVNQPFDRLRITLKEKEFTAAIRRKTVSLDDVGALKTQLTRYRLEREGALSMPLILNLLFLEEFLERDPGRFLSLRAGRG